MKTKIQGASDLSQYSFEVALSKRRAGQAPVFGSYSQIQGVSADIDSQTVSVSATDEPFLLSSFTSKAESVWRLNANPMVRIVMALPLEKFMPFIDFAGFSKNNVLGIRFLKTQLGQSSPWFYGVTQYPVPRLETERRNIQIEGYGLLFEAQRRQQARGFKNQSAMEIISTIVRKYNVRLSTRGNIQDRQVAAAEQNESDFGYINQMSYILDAYWYLENSDLVLIGRDYMYRQTPSVALVFGSLPDENLSTNFPISEFTPMLSAQSFEAGALVIRGGGIDLDSGDVVTTDFKPKGIRLGSLALTSEQFLSDAGVSINNTVLRPAPELRPDEAGLILPLNTRSNDSFVYQYSVEHKDLAIRSLVTCPGLPAVKPGEMVRLSGVGETFGGNWVVEEIAHSAGTDTGYVSTLTLVRNALGQLNVPTQFPTNTKAIEDKPDSTVRKFAEVDR